MPPQTFAIIGLGLMGGSFAKALRALPAPPERRIFACDADPRVLRAAADGGVIDRGFPPAGAAEMLSQAGIVFICLYPAQTAAFLREHRADFAPGSLVTDISGVKAPIAAVFPDIASSRFDFITGHPMAGSEKEGFSCASAAVFRGRTYLLMPQPWNTAAHLEFFKALALSLGFARVIETTCAAHDSKIAFTSQLCHVIACALVDSAEDTGVTAFGGGSFEDLTRIAMINAPLWTELFSENKTALLSRITAFERSLGELKSMLNGGQDSGLRQRLESIRGKRIAMAHAERREAPPPGISSATTQS